MKFFKIFLISIIITAVLLSLSACGLSSRLLAYFTYGEADVSVEHEIQTGPDEKSGAESMPALENPSQEPAVEATDIIGEWITAYREGDTIYTCFYTFKEDGTYYTGGGEYLHTSHYPELFAEYDEGWQPAPMGFPYEYGTYTYSEGILVLCCLESDMEEYDQPIISRLKISEYDGERAVFVFITEHHEGQPRMFLKNAEYYFLNVEGLFEAAGVDTEP